MKTKNKKSAQIIYGILTAVALWISAILLSGQLPLGENIELYHTGPLVIIFPFVFLAFCISVAKYSAKSHKATYYKTSIVCFIVPFIGWILSLLLNFIAQETTPVIQYIANYISLIFTVPLVSVYLQLISLLPISTDGLILILISIAYFIPMVVGFLVSLKIYNADKTRFTL